ncbi:MAG: AmmeMemoRadiSam system protein B [Sulfurimonas sp.]|nr:AmmeMemoRadiSam system protein B [Sulfurimonas sp.]
MKRKMSVAGSFYPNNSSEIIRYFEYFSKLYKKINAKTINSKVVIVPHAGYIYSGYSANIAYKILQKSHLKNIIVIGPSHQHLFDGISLCNFDSYDTPFGEILSAKDLAKKLYDRFELKSLEQAHAEHSTETQFPFIKYYLKNVNMLELVYSRVDSYNVSKIIDFILKQEDCGIIISTDLSHFYNLDKANKLDSICISAIKKLDINLLNTECEACGKIGLEAVIKSAKNNNLTSHILDYKTSADASSDESRVVGYVSACFN